MRTLRLRGLSFACACAALVDGGAAQAEFVNFETHPVEPLAVARVAGHDYLLVCNTPDNSVEIYDTVGNAFLQRVPVGLRPVTVVWNAALGRFYTANFLGDSVSVVRLSAQGGGVPVARIERTSFVGDEPTDVAFLPDNQSFFVTLQSRSAFGWFGSLDVFPVGGAFGMRIGATFPLLDPLAPKALKNPRRILFEGTMLTILGQHGGNAPAYDFDLYTFDLGTGLQTELGGLGSTNFNLARASNGRLFVVGTMARNDVQGEAAVSAEPTGFVQSRLWVVDGAGTAGASVAGRDLNRYRDGKVVAKSEAVAAPTAVALFERAGRLQKVFVTGFGSDRIGVLTVEPGDPSTWPMRRIELPNTGTIGGYARTGPRGLAIKTPAPLTPDDPGARLYTYNSLDQSISVIDPVAETEVARLRLRNDPTPDVVRQGRRFLYGADLSGNGFVSCSSCHVDGRTDVLAWNLGVPGGGTGAPIPDGLIDGVTGSGLGAEFPDDKGPMVTQTLQGLVNHPVGGQAQYLFTNAPYHWRGDRASFAAFNGAFVSLLGAPDVGPPGQPKGLEDPDMARFRAMIETVVYPPNPEQPKDRRYSGSFGDPDLEDGDGAARGLKLFLGRPFQTGIIAGRSCVQCHALPEGSNNRITLTDDFGGTGEQPIETAATRGLFEREARLETSPQSISPTVTSEFGLLHPGPGQLSINQFMLLGFGGLFPGQEIFKLVDITAFVREMDSGIAPIVGVPWTVDSVVVGAPVNGNVFDLLEGQVLEANAGLAVHAETGTSPRGLFFDATLVPAAYRDVDSGAVLSRAQLLALVAGPGDRLIAQATPAGSERRVASPDGVAGAPVGPAPSGVTLEPLTVSTSWEDVPSVTKNWPVGTGPDHFNWTGERSPGVPAEEPRSLKTLRIYQQALAQEAPELGLTKERHEAPRRFCVLGRDIAHGAQLVLLIPADPATPPPYGGGGPVQALTMGLFPTGERAPDGRRYWETTAEVDALVAYGLLLGGPFAPGVVEAYKGELPEPPPPGAFDPKAWNLYFVSVVNPDGKRDDAGWQRLRIE